MKKTSFIALFLLLFVVLPVLLAWNQDVPTRFLLQRVVLFLSLGGFGLMLGQFWLSRLLPRWASPIKRSAILRWHKYIGYSVGALMLLHPILLVLRRFWAQESNPFDNLMLMISAPAMLPAVIAWILLAVLIVVAFFRRRFAMRSWRILHGLLSSAFIGTATWHVLSIGRHSNATLSIFWIALAAGTIVALLRAYIPEQSASLTQTHKEVAHESF